MTEESEECLSIVQWLKDWFTSTDDLIDKTYPIGSIWIIFINDIEKYRKAYTWTNQRVPRFYTNSGRIQRIKNITIKRI